MRKSHMFWMGVASALDLDATYAETRKRQAMSKLMNFPSRRIQGSSPHGALKAVGIHLQNAMSRYEQQFNPKRP
jgi:hypothetical protein